MPWLNGFRSIPTSASGPSFLKLYNESFPPDERRELKDEEHLANFIKMKGGKFNAFAAKDGDLFLAFLSYWTFEGYVYIEHFAVDPAHRSKNIGRKMLSHLFDIAGPNVLIEVEKPEDSDDARRRVEFYEKNGFKLREDINYVQPPYSAEQSGMEMMLMTHGDVKLHDTRDLREMLTEVYNVNTGV